MLLSLDLEQMPSCTRFGRMIQRNRWNRQGIAQKNINLMVYVVSGTAVFSVGENHYTLKHGDALLIPANIPYSADTDDICDYYFLHFTGDITQIEKLEAYPPAGNAFSFDVPDPAHRRITLTQKTETADFGSKFYNCLTECEELHNSGTFSGRLGMDNILCRLLLMLAQITEQQHITSGYPIVLDKMLGYIHKNLTKSVTAAELCRYCGISGSYAARIFRKHLNTTITQYITDQKLSYAWELMCNTGMNVSQIASHLDFCDVYYFSRRFKEKYGKSPTKMFLWE